MKLKWSMQQGIILITGIAGHCIETGSPVFQVVHQLQREVGMQAFIVMQWLIAKSPKAQGRSKQDDAPESNTNQQLLARGWRRKLKSVSSRLLNQLFININSRCSSFLYVGGAR